MLVGTYSKILKSSAKSKTVDLSNSTSGDGPLQVNSVYN